MTIVQALEWAQQKLENCENPSTESEVLLAALLQKDRIFLKTQGDLGLSWWKFFQYRRYILKRRKHIPVAYILGEKIFLGLRIFIHKNVLIPRDETEILCQHIVESYKANPPPQSILDVGTGSGCIAIYLGIIFPQAEVMALDISSQSLDCAQKNADKENRTIRFLQSDLLSSVPEASFFDLIVANLPYLPDTLSVSPEVHQEPSWALFSGSDGLDHIRKFEQELRLKKIQFSALWLEFLPIQKEKIKDIFSKYSVEFYTDIGGHVFFVKIQQPSDF